MAGSGLTAFPILSVPHRIARIVLLPLMLLLLLLLLLSAEELVEELELRACDAG